MSTRIEGNSYRDVLVIPGSRGILYRGHETIRERGFKIGDRVNVGAAYSEPVGKVVGMDDEIPYKAQVELTHSNGMRTICWIKSEHLEKIEDAMDCD